MATGTINIVEDDDTLVATGTAFHHPVGTISITEEDDTLVAWGISPPQYSIAALDVTTVYDKSTETTVIDYNNVTNIYDEKPEIIVNKEPVIQILTEGIQGPAGPPTGFSTAKEFLPFIGSGIGTTKTTTNINGNVIYEEFDIDDEVYMNWIIPIDIDRGVSPRFEGTFFTDLDNGGTHTCSWEIHVTVHNKTHTYEYSDVIYANDLVIPAGEFTETHAFVELDHTLFLDNNTYIMHVKLKRVTSTNDVPVQNNICVSDIHMVYGTEGRVGIAGPAGPDGRPEDDVMYEKRVDFISDGELYRGEAVPGTLDSDGVWRIRKITLSAIDDDVVETWANGNDTFDKVWDDRLTYTYNY